jgi:transcriptional regulator with XRE-family HTH domain
MANITPPPLWKRLAHQLRVHQDHRPSVFLFVNYDDLLDFLALICHKRRVMRITKEATDEAVLRELGGRLARVRLDRNVTQAQVAEQAGVSKRTVERLESGSAGTQLPGFLRVCRALDIIERFDMLVPEPVPSPIEQLKLRGRKRRRSSPSKDLKPPSAKWEWKDER